MPSVSRTHEKRLPVIEAANPIGLTAPIRDDNLWRKVYREDAWRKQGRVCAYCLEPLKRDQVTADHVKPIKQGGQTSAKNIKACCSPCNSAKGSWPENKFKRAIRNPVGFDMGHHSFKRQMKIYRAHGRWMIWNRTKRALNKIGKYAGLERS